MFLGYPSDGHALAQATLQKRLLRSRFGAKLHDLKVKHSQASLVAFICNAVLQHGLERVDGGSGSIAAIGRCDKATPRRGDAA